VCIQIRRNFDAHSCPARRNRFLRVVWQHLRKNIRPGDSRQTSNEPTRRERSPAFSRLKWVFRDCTTTERLQPNNFIALESCCTINAEACSQDENQARARKTASNFSRVSGSKRAEFDERAGHEETVSESNFNPSKQRSNTSAIGWKVGQEVRDVRRRGHGSLEHTNEWITIDGLDDLNLFGRCSCNRRGAAERVHDRWTSACQSVVPRNSKKRER